MSGKLPIDRVREAEAAPRVYQDHKQRLAEDQARLRQLGSSPADLDALQSIPEADESQPDRPTDNPTKEPTNKTEEASRA